MQWRDYENLAFLNNVQQQHHPFKVCFLKRLLILYLELNFQCSYLHNMHDP